MSSVSAFSSMPCSIRNLYNQQGPRSAISLPFLSTYIHNSSLSMQHHPQSRHSRPNPPLVSFMPQLPLPPPPSSLPLINQQSEPRHQQPSSESASQRAREPDQSSIPRALSRSQSAFLWLPATDTHKASLLRLHKPDQSNPPNSTDPSFLSCSMPHAIPQNISNHIKSSPSSTISVRKLVASASSLPLSTPTAFPAGTTAPKRKAEPHCLLLTDACHRLDILIASINTNFTMISEIRSYRFWNGGQHRISSSRHHEERWLALMAGYWRKLTNARLRWLRLAYIQSFGDGSDGYQHGNRLQ